MRRPRTPAPTLGGWIVGGALLAAAVLAPGLGSYHVYVFALVAIQVMAVLSLNLLMGYAGQVSLGQAAFVGMGAFGAAQLAAWGVPFPATVLVAATLTAGAAAIVGLPSLRIRGLHLAVTTLAFGLAAELLLFSRPWDPAASMGVAVARPQLIASDRAFLEVTLVALVVVLVLDRNVRRSRIGRAFLAIRDREDIAPARGIPVGITKLLAYALAGSYAGLAGGLYAYLLERVTAEPFSVWTSLEYVAAAVIGGLGSWSGAAVAAGAFTALPELLRPVALFAPLAGALLLAIVPAVRPRGLGALLGRRPRGPVGLLLRRSAPGHVTTRPAAATPAVLTRPRRALALDLPLRTMLTVEDVHVSFGGLHVLTGVDLVVERGSITGLIGPNGAGKSTLFNVVSGFVAPSRGRVRYQGGDLLARPAHARAALGIGRTFQHPGLGPDLSVLANVLIAQHTLAVYDPIAGLLRTPRVRRTEDALQLRTQVALEAVGMADQQELRAGSLPQMQQRLVEIAAAVAAGPRLLLLDEPAAGVSAEEASELSTRLRALRDALDLTIVVIEHHVPMVVDLCDEVHVLADGRVICSGPPRVVQDDPEVQRVYLGVGDEDDVVGPTDVPDLEVTRA